MKTVVVGLGSIGRRHVKNLKILNPDMEIGVLREFSKDPDMGDVRACVSQVFFELKEALDWKPEVAIIANPAPFHVKTALEFARESTHLFVEKPLSDSLGDVDLLLAECKKRKLKLMTGYCLRFHEPLRIIKKSIEEGKIGRVLFIHATSGQYLPNWRPETDYRQNVSARKELGGGVVFELSHEIDYMRWLCGEVQEVQGFLGKRSDLEIDVEDVAEINFRFESGIMGHIHLDMIDHARNRGCRIIGTDGTLVWDFVDNHCVRLFSRQEKTWTNLRESVPLDINQMFVHQFEHFFQCVNNGQEPFVTGQDGKRVIEIALAVKRSAQEGVTVKV